MDDNIKTHFGFNAIDMERIHKALLERIELLAAAYIKETNIPASQAVINMQYTWNGVKFWVSNKEEQ
jgi:hypothetical protein